MTVRTLASAAFSAWDEMVDAVSATTPPELMELARGVVGAAFGTSGAPAERSAAAAFGEQVVIDVASLTDEARAAAVTELGGSATAYLLAIWIEDMAARANRAFRELLGEEPMAKVSSGRPAGDPWAAQGRFLLEVAKLDALDPVTTELVRLRGARAHACRLCQSRRNVTALEMAGRTDLFEPGDPTGLTGAQEVALSVVDIFVWQPFHWPDGLGSEATASLGPAAAVELVLDIVRNAANKIAVGFAADAPQVESGVEYFAVDTGSGELRYDVRPPSAT